MSPLQFALFFSGLLVAYGLVHLRLVRFEGYLRELGGIRALDERTKELSARLERVRLEHVEEQLEVLHDDLKELIHASARVERQLSSMRIVDASGEMVVEGAPAPQPSTGEGSPGSRVRALVESRLLSLGYNNLRILSDLGEISLEDSVDVRVECERESMRYKGRVLTQNGAIRDLNLKSMAQSFP